MPKIVMGLVCWAVIAPGILTEGVCLSVVQSCLAVVTGALMKFLRRLLGLMSLVVMGLSRLARGPRLTLARRLPSSSALPGLALRRLCRLYAWTLGRLTAITVYIVSAVVAEILVDKLLQLCREYTVLAVPLIASLYIGDWGGILFLITACVVEGTCPLVKPQRVVLMLAAIWLALILPMGVGALVGSMLVGPDDSPAKYKIVSNMAATRTHPGNHGTPGERERARKFHRVWAKVHNRGTLARTVDKARFMHASSLARRVARPPPQSICTTQVGQIGEVPGCCYIHDRTCGQPGPVAPDSG